MTDLGKGEIEGNGGSFVKKFKLAENEDYRKRCFDYLNYELGLLNGKDTIIVCMHSGLKSLLSKYGNINKRNGYKKILYVTHYSYTYNGYGNDNAFYKFAGKSWKKAVQEVANAEKRTGQ